MASSASSNTNIHEVETDGQTVAVLYTIGCNDVPGTAGGAVNQTLRTRAAYAEHVPSGRDAQCVRARWW